MIINAGLYALTYKIWKFCNNFTAKGREGSQVKQLKEWARQLLNGVLLGALTIPLILLAISVGADKPTLSFEGAKIQVAADGSTQLLFDICLSGNKLKNGDYHTIGTQFTLNFNADYIMPSDYESNEVLGDPEDWFDPTGDATKAFAVNEDLYHAAGDKNPFKWTRSEIDQIIDYDNNRLSLYLALDNISFDETSDYFEAIPVGESGDLRTVFKINGDKLKLGTLSFRVTDTSKVPEIIAEFNEQSNLLLEDNHGKIDSSKKLIYFTQRASGKGTEPWAILFYTKEQRDERHQTINDYNNDAEAQALFSYNFPKTIISARAANAELTLNAYQVYTGADLDGDGVLEGTVGDIDSALQRYSPAITVTYSDGSEGNFIMPWSQSTTVNDLPWSATTVYDMDGRVVVDTVADSATQIKYDPAHTPKANANQLYRVSKSFCYKDDKGDAQTFPVPIEVKLTVTPVTLVDLTADELERSYALSDQLVTQTVTKMSDLELPTMARLTTDVPVGNGTLTMDIPGWGQKQGTNYVDGSDLSKLVKNGAADDTVEHFPVSADIDNGQEWTDTESNGKLRGNNRAGVYEFNMTQLVGGTLQGYLFTKDDIQDKYPWMTVNKDEWDLTATRTVVWNDTSSDTTEELVDTTKYLVTYVSTVTETLTTTTNPAEADQPKLTLQVGKEGTSLPDGTQFRVRLPDGTVIGNGVTVGATSLADWFTDVVDGTDANTGYYNTKRSDSWSNPQYAYQLYINPGDVANDNGANKTEREKLRRYINLGGWFAVSIKESGKADDTTVATTTWSDFIPVYVPPRENLYAESKEYNFIGKTAELFPWQGGVSTTVVLPQGTYKDVDTATGELNGNELNYGVKTTYNGNTGEQGDAARLYTFTIDPTAPNTDWKTATNSYGNSKYYTRYGADYFFDHALYAAYGWVENVMDLSDPTSYDSTNAKTATIRVEKENKTFVTEGLVLEYVATDGGGKSIIETTNANGYTNVQEVIFEAKQEGYTLRQTYTLRLRNVGTTDVEGIALDLLTDVQKNTIYDKNNDSNPAGGHFEILQAPASYLKAGDSTTFVITYVYDLKAYNGSVADYKDKIYITGNGKTAVGAGKTAGTDYLLDFDAQFSVSPEKLHRVTVNVVPVDKTGTPTMGNAGVIVGEISGTMNKSAGTTAYAQGNTVYILVEPYDEYEIASITAKDSAGNLLSGDNVLQQFNVTKDADGHFIYYFEMPDDDVTVTVAFEEKIPSKLRLSDLRVYSSKAQTNHYPWTGADALNDALNNWNDTKKPLQKTIWQKRFTEQEQTDAATMMAAQSGNQEADDLYLMTGQGTAATAGYKSTEAQYVVVIPAEDDWAQVEVDLREVLYLFKQADYPDINLGGRDYENTVLEKMTVQMALFDTKPDNMTWDDYKAYIGKLLSSDASVYTDIYPNGIYNWDYNNSPYSINPYAQVGQTNPPTTHTSIPFESPEQGKSKYVRVTVSYKPNNETNSTTRSYYIEIHRAKAEPEAELNYGNSPFGMIMNDATMTVKEKERAKTAFVANDFTFDDINSQLTEQNKKDGLTNLVPAVVKDADLEKLHYWIEAWAPPTETWGVAGTDWALDSDWTNANLTTGTAVYDAETGMSETHYKERTDTTKENTINLDLNSYSFFAIMGESFTDAGLSWAKDSSGRYVDLSEVVITLEQVDTLTTTADKDSSANQKTRFTASTSVKVAFVDGTTNAEAKSGATVTAKWAATDADGNTVELRPGRYKLTYTYPDYNYIPADPAAGTSESGDHLTVTRDFVVLAPVGDVNADGVLTGTVDEYLIEKRFSVANTDEPALGYMAYNSDAIHKLRTVDVNNDRNINDADANAISKGKTVGKFYLPIGYKPTPDTP